MIEESPPPTELVGHKSNRLNDTCWGINNEGQLSFDYYHEDTDTLDGANVYNGQNSTLWCNFREAFADEIQETYQKLRGDGLITYDILEEQFITKGSDKWSESVFNEDGEFKYISMVKSDNDASNLPFARGDGEQHFRYFVENRLNYCDSKWYATDYANDYVSLRIYTPTTWAGVEPNADITVVPYSNMYAGVRYKANGTLYQERVEHGEEITFEAPDETFNDTETAIYGASQLSSLGDLAPLYCGTVNVANATKLTEIKIGDGTTGYANNNLKELSVGTNKLLKKIDIQNCPSFTSALGLAGCQNIEEIYAKGSGITGVELANSGYLKIIQLPATIANLTIKNQEYIEEFSMEGYGALKTLLVENCPAIDTLSILDNATNLERVRLTGVEWEYDDTSFLYELKARNLAGIDENGANTDIMWLDGTCHIKSLTGAEMAEINAMFPYLKITYDNLETQLIYNALIDLSCATDESGVLVFNNEPTVDENGVLIIHDAYNPSVEEDGTLALPNGQIWGEVYRETIINGGNGNDPVIAGLLETPTKDSTPQYDFTHSGWSKVQDGEADETALLNVETDRHVYAAFSQEIRHYTVNFYINGELKESYSTPYMGTATFQGSTAHPTDPDIFEFVEWKPSPANITGDTNCYAQYYDMREIQDSWATIEANCINGTATSKYAIGSYKPVEITYEDGTSETIDMEVIAHNHDELGDGIHKWESVSKMPLYLEDGRALVYNNELHVMGGNYAANKHYKFNGTEWVEVSTAPYQLLGFSAVVYNNEIHIMGGSGGNTNHYKWNGSDWISVGTLPFNYNRGVAVVYNNEIHLYADNVHASYNGTEWSSIDSSGVNAINSGVIIHDNEIHIIGGNTNCHYIYNGSEYRSSTPPPNIIGRLVAIGIIDGKIHVIGTTSGDPEHYEWDGAEWTQCGALPISCVNSTGVEYNGEIHLLGGKFSSGHRDCHWKWSTASWVESEIPNWTSHTRGVNSHLVVWNNELYSLNDAWANKLRKWNGDSWEDICDLPYAFNGGTAVVYNNEIHMLGGGGGSTSHYKWNGAEWVSVSTLPIAPTSKAVIYNNEIHFLGETSHYKFNGTEWISVSTPPYKISSKTLFVYDNKIHTFGVWIGYVANPYRHYTWDGNEWKEAPVLLPYSTYDQQVVIYNDEIHLLSGGNGIGETSHYKWNGSEWVSVSTLPHGTDFVVLYRGKIYMGAANKLFSVYQNPKATLTFMAKNLLKDDRVWNETATFNNGSYKDCSLRTYLNGNFVTALPIDLQFVIKEVSKTRIRMLGHYTIYDMVKTIDKCWIPNDDELGANAGDFNIEGDGNPYNVFTDNNSRKRAKNDGIYYAYFTASPYSANDSPSRVNCVGNDGSLLLNYASSREAHTKQGILIGFCI